MTSILAVLGVLSALGSVAFAFQIAHSYVRHMATGDQAGAALGIYFFTSFVAPLAGLMLMGGFVASERGARSDDTTPQPSVQAMGIEGLRILGGVVLQLAGVFMLLFGLASLALLDPGRGSRVTAELVASVVLGCALVPVAYGLLLWVCGVRLRTSDRTPGSSGDGNSPLSRRFLWTAGAFTVSLIVSLVAAVIGLYRQGSEPNAPPTLWEPVLVFHTPTLVMVALLATLLFVYARRLRRARSVAAP